MGKLKQRIHYIFYFLLFVEIIGYICFFFSAYGKAMLSSDMTTVVQLTEQCLKENTLFPKNWFYANTTSFPIFLGMFIVFYKITKDYIISIMISKVFQFVLMLLSLAYFMKKILKLRNEIVAIGLLVLLSPISNLYFKNVFFDGYSVRIAIWFLMLSLGLQCVKDNQITLNKKYLLWYCVIIFAFVTGDMRYLATLVLPLIVAIACCYLTENAFKPISDLYRPLKRFGLYLLTVLGTVGICKIAESVLKKGLVFVDGYYGGRLFPHTELGNMFERLQAMIISFLQGFGYIGGVSQMSFYSVVSLCIIGFLTYISLICPLCMLRRYKDYSLTLQRIIVFRWVGYAVSIYFWLFTDTGIEFRHVLTYVVLDIILFLYYFEKNVLSKKIILTVVGWGVLFFYVCLNWTSTSYNTRSIEALSKRMEIISEIEGRGLKYGYAPYWNASVTGAFSQERLKIYPWFIDSKMEWYSPVELYLPASENERTFLLLTQKQYEENMQNRYFATFYSDYEEIVREDGWVVLIYDYNIACHFKENAMALGKNLLKYMSYSDESLIMTEDVVFLEKGEFCYGPYMALEEGAYIVNITVSDDANLSVYEEGGENVFITRKLHSGKNSIPFFLENDTESLEFNIGNDGDTDLELTELAVCGFPEEAFSITELLSYNDKVEAEETHVLKIEPDGIIYGPYTILPSGRYYVDISVEGTDNINDMFVKFVSGNSSTEIYPVTEVNGDTRIEFELEEMQQDFEIVIWNEGDVVYSVDVKLGVVMLGT